MWGSRPRRPTRRDSAAGREGCAPHAGGQRVASVRQTEPVVGVSPHLHGALPHGDQPLLDGNGCRGRHHDVMVFTTDDTLRERIRRALDGQAGPVTAAHLAGQLLPPDLDSARRQVQRALAQLEATGHAVRRHGQWSAAHHPGRAR